MSEKEDPVFRLIAAAKAADEAYDVATSGKSVKVFWEPDTQQRFAELENAEEVLGRTVPQTPAGTLAYARYWLRSNRGFRQSLLEALKRELTAER
jgi:hypothetical protein